MHAAFEPGLPGTGPLPIHLHQGRPTPWSEGVVIRVTPDCGDEWIANLQSGYGYATKIIYWELAKSIVVIVGGAIYLIFPDDPQRWRFIDDLGIDCQISHAHEL